MDWAEVGRKTSARVSADRALQNRVKEIKAKGIGKLKLDIAFVCDCTGSMQSYIDAAKKYCVQIVKSTEKNYGSDRVDIRLAFVGYRDISDSKPREVLPFESAISGGHNRGQAERLQTFLATINADGGGDLPEDLTGALADTLALKWRRDKDTSKLAILIADAPCHGHSFRGSGNSWEDKYPDGDPNGRCPLQLIEQFRQSQINVSFFEINKNNTAEMLRQLKEKYRKGRPNTPSAYRLGVYELGADIDNFLKMSLDSIQKSVTASSVRSMNASTRSSMTSLSAYTSMKPKFRPSLVAAMGIVEEEEDESPVKQAPSFSDRVDNNWEPTEVVEEYTVDSEGRPRRRYDVQIARHHFAEGGMRAAYYIKNLECHKVMVAKEGKLKGSKFNSKEAHFGDMDSHKCAQALASRWNDLPTVRTDKSKSISFLEAKVLHFPDRPVASQRQWMMVEPLLPNQGMFRKYNNNYGFVDPSDECEIPNAFSHWTWCATGGECMVADMQGVQRDTLGYLCTDPQVQHIERGRYGRGNLGEKGIAAFFAAHKCGRMCKTLGLHRPGEVTEDQARAIVLDPENTVVAVPVAIPIVPPERAVAVDEHGDEFASRTTLSAPGWVPDQEVFSCMRKTSPGCRAAGGYTFGLSRRRHHCRVCGLIVCNECSPGKIRLPYATPVKVLGIFQSSKLEKQSESRICDVCIDAMTGAKKSGP